MSELNAIISKKIKMLRETEGLYQADLAIAIGLKQSNLSGYERDTLPPLEALINISQYFGVTLDWLCDNKISESDAVQELQDKIDHLIYLENEAGRTRAEIRNLHKSVNERKNI